MDREALYFHYPHYHSINSMGPSGAIRMGKYKLIEVFETGKIELYNLEDDMGEQNDLVEKMPKNNTKTMPENQNETTNVLVGYVRKSNAGGALKVSINTDAFSDCSTYVTSDGQAYVPLVISLNALEKVLNGERAVTTLSQLQD